MYSLPSHIRSYPNGHFVLRYPVLPALPELIKVARDWDEEWVDVVNPVGSTSGFLRQHTMLQMVAPMLVENRQ